MASGLYAGAVADRFDRRRVLVLSLALQLLASLALAVLTFAGRQTAWSLYLVTGASAGLVTMEQAARSATVPRLVGAGRLASALSLFQLLVQSALVVGPAVAGVAIAALGLRWAYAIDAACFAAALAMVLRMGEQRPERGHAVTMGLRAPLEGLRFAWGRPAIIACFVIDLNAMVFGMPRALFPALATGVFHTGPQGMGLLFAAPATGALGASVFSGWVRHARRQGQLVIGAVIGWGAAIAIFGLSNGSFPLALLMLAFAGACDMVSAVFRNTILQLATPDHLRGRLSALYSMVVTSGPRLGDLEAGAVASLTSPIFSVVSGGVACVLGAVLVAGWLPALRRQRLESAAELVDDAEVVESG